MTYDDDVVVVVVVVVSSYSGQDAASQSLELDLSTVLNADVCDERAALNRGRAQAVCRRSMSVGNEVIELMRQERDVMRHERDVNFARTDACWSVSAEIALSDQQHDCQQPHSNHIDEHLDVVAADDDETVDIFHDVCDIDTDTVSAVSARDTDSESVCQRAESRSRDRRTLCNGRVVGVTSEQWCQPQFSPTSSSSSTSSLSSWWWSWSGLLLILSALFLALIFVLCGLLVMAYVVLESQVDVAVVRSIRHLPEVCEFYRDEYLTWRSWIIGQLDTDTTQWQCLRRHVTTLPSVQLSNRQDQRSSSLADDS